jgi:TatD family hydrolase
MSHKSPELINGLKSDLEAGRLARVIDVGTDPGDLYERLPLMERCGVDWFSLGLYPNHASADPVQLIADLETTIGKCLSADGKSHKPTLVAIGEIGLDCHRDYAPILDQIELFNVQVALANRFSLPILVHNRSADRHLEEALSSCPPLHGGIMHCFSSDYGFACQMLDKGFLISFAGNLTYKSSAILHDTARRLPLERIVLETDSPYLAPVPLRGQPNCPVNVRLVYEFLAMVRGIEVEACAEQISQNISCLFKH